MSEQRYDIFFRGEGLDGFELDSVKNSVGQLFKASPAKVEQLFSGKVIALKKDLDKPTAAKFKQVLEKAGAKIYVKLAAEATAAAPEKATKPTPAPASAQPAPTATEKPATPSAAAPRPAEEEIHLDMMPAGTDVLSEDERTHFEEADIDVSSIKLASTFDVAETNDEPPPPAPDVSFLTTAEVGADVMEGYQDDTPPPPAPDVSFISTAEVGADVLEGFHDDTPPPPAPDVSHITTAEVGADIDPSEKKEPPPSPDVSHIKLED